MSTTPRSLQDETVQVVRTPLEVSTTHWLKVVSAAQSRLSQLYEAWERADDDVFAQEAKLRELVRARRHLEQQRPAVLLRLQQRIAAAAKNVQDRLNEREQHRQARDIVRRDASGNARETTKAEEEEKAEEAKNARHEQLVRMMEDD